MKYLSLLFASALFLTACNSTSNNQFGSKNNEDNTDTITPFTLASTFHQTLKGNIGESTIIMELIGEDSLIRGSYYYEKIGTPIDITGKLKPNGEFELSEKNMDGEEMAIFSGKFHSAFQLKGLWGKVKSDKHQDFTLNATNTLLNFYNKKTYNQKNCEFASQSESDEEMMPWDTMCTTLNIDLIQLQLSNASISKKINNSLEKQVLSFSNAEVKPKTIQGFLNSVNEIEEDWGFKQEIWSDIVAVSNGSICVSISSFIYGFGSAHPYSYSNFYNYDLQDGHLIRLEELLIPNFKTKLNKVAEKIFVKANGSDLWFFEKGKFELNRDFAIFPTGLLFTFDAYEIGPYAAGAPTVFIPYKEIQPLIKKKGLLDKMCLILKKVYF